MKTMNHFGMKLFTAMMAMILLVTGLGITAAGAEGISTASINSILNKYGFKSGAYWTYDYTKVSKTTSALDAAATSGYRASSKPYGTQKYASKYYKSSNTYYGEYIFRGGRQCYGFANFIGYQLTGSVPTESWTRYTSVSQVEKAGGLKVGDVIRAGGHSAMVLKVSGSTIYTVECWGSTKSRNKIAVGGYFNGNSGAKTLKQISSKYGLSCVYRYKGTKTDTSAPVISASGEKYPAQGSALNAGASFGLRGVYTTSSGKITAVTASVKDKNGKAVFSYSAKPNAAKYDVNGTKGTNGKTLNNTVLFNKLAVGTYTLSVTIQAENAGKKAVKTVTRVFTVTSKPVFGVEKAFNGPDRIRKGSGFGLRGIVNVKNGKITQVTASVLNASGSAVMIYVAKPGTAAFDVTKTKGTNGKSLNDTMVFNNLGKGTYTYNVTITAQGDGGTARYDYSRKFVVE